MVTPRNVSYSIASASSLAVGAPSIIPSWVSSAPTDQWGVIPVAAALSTLNPKDNAAINPNYPNYPEWYGQTGMNALMETWCGGTYDPKRDELWLPLQGGHGDYGGNEPYKLSLQREVPAWTMIRPPSGALPNPFATIDGLGATGIYADGQPRAIHSYAKCVWVPTLDQPWICMQGGTWNTGQVGTTKPIAIDRVTGLGTMKTAHSGDYLGGQSASGACFDPTRGTKGCFWTRAGGGSPGKMHRYDIATDTWTEALGDYFGMINYVALAYMQEYDCIFMTYGGGIAIYDCATGTYYSPTVTGTISADILQCQPLWVNGKVYVWNNSSNFALITRLTPTGNPRTAGWTADTLPLSGSNSVVPSTKATYGTYGRFQYSSNLGIFVLVNNISGSCFFFKPQKGTL